MVQTNEEEEVNIEVEDRREKMRQSRRLTIVSVMSLGNKMGVPITVLTLFGRFDKRWRLHLVFFIFLMYKH